jgi:hypothetical protein
MADDEIQRIEAVFGALSKIAAGESEAPDAGLQDARCPKCGKSDFVRVSDLYSEVVARLQEDAADADAVRIAGLTDRQLVARLAPPQRRSAAFRVAMVAIPLGAIAAFAYLRLGDVIGQLAIGLAIVVTIVVLMTTLRRVSDEYYDRKARWNRLYMCRSCGQLVSS